MIKKNIEEKSIEELRDDIESLEDEIMDLNHKLDDIECDVKGEASGYFDLLINEYLEKISMSPGLDIILSAQQVVEDLRYYQKKLQSE